jgi:hypothetical protein
MRIFFAVLLLSSAALTFAQQKEPDVLVFTNGDKLTGTLERAVGDSVVFKSDMAGELTIPYSKIKELNTHQAFAIVEKGKRITPKTLDSEVPHGVVSVANNTITVANPATQAQAQVPIANADYVIQEATFHSDLRGKTSFFKGWDGTVTLGASLVKATQSDYAANAAIALVRSIPLAAYLAPRNRTTAGLTFNYGEVTTPMLVGGMRVNQVARTDIYHAEAERDQYLSPRVYYLGHLAYDHNYSQGLKLAQLYGGGFGWTVVKQPKQELDLKADVHYTRESFYPPAQNENLIGSAFADNYLLRLPHSLMFTQFATVSPAFNNLNATAASAGVSLAAPLYKRFSLSASAIDSFINNPGFISPGIPSKKNSIQFTTGLTYTLR